MFIDDLHHIYKNVQIIMNISCNFTIKNCLMNCLLIISLFANS